MKIPALFTLTLLSQALSGAVAYAQGGSSGMGGGGDILVCREAGGIRRYLLDTYEEKNRYAIDAGNGATLEERLAAVLTRFADLDPVRAKRYAEETAILLADIRQIREWRRGGKTAEQINQLMLAQVQAEPRRTTYVLAAEIELKDIDDADEIYDYRAVGCGKKQLIRQETNISNGSLEYTIDFDLLDSFGDDPRGLNQQVAAVMHEVIYHERRDLGAKTSKDSRKFNRMILDPGFAAFPSCRYAREIKNMGFGSYWILGTADSSKVKLTCDAQENIVTVSAATYPFGGKVRSNADSPPLALTQVTLEDGRRPVSATHSGRLPFPYVGGTLGVTYADNREIRGGLIKFREDKTLSWEGVTKSGDSGSIRMVTDSGLKVLSLQDEGYYNDVIDSEAEQVYTQLIWEVKKQYSSYAQNSAARNRALQVIRWVRAGVPMRDLNRVRTGIAALTDSSIAIPEGSADAGAQEWLDSLGMDHLTGCRLRGLALHAGGFVVVRLGVMKLSCSHYNGDTSEFKAKIQSPIAMGGGVGVFRLRQDITEFFVGDRLPRINQDGTLFLSATPELSGNLGVLSVGIDSFGEDQMSWGVGLGIYIGLFDGNARFKLKKTRMGILGLPERFTAKILVDRSVYPKH